MSGDGGRCLNCDAELHGAFCAACGQRSVPSNPTVNELAGDAWQELSGYDGRIASTLRSLFHPGRLTLDYISGRRARYLPPVRLYLIVSVAYFLLAAAAPQDIISQTTNVEGPRGFQVQIRRQAGGRLAMSDEDRAKMLTAADRAPWFIRPVFRSLATDPDAFRVRMFTYLPRIVFGMLPVFAAIVALFYRGRHFPTALVFSTHVHAFAFLVFMLAPASRFSGQPIVSGVVGLIAAVVFVSYTLLALRAVFGGGWLATVARAAGIAFLYLLAAIPAFLVLIAWVSLS